ncbi:MAG TPA: DUF4388 domain-containing protein [Candidatus Eisenbacteria bacterium]|jgi:hypothetical protein
MSLVGSLHDLSLPELLSIIALGQKTGVLTIQADAGSGQIHVRDGRILQASDPFRDERFGEILMKRGKVTLADLETALETQEHSRGALRLGRILIDMGKITRADQDDAIVYQTTEAVYDLCTWSVGYFQFDSNLAPDSIGVELPIHTVLEEVRRREKAGEQARRVGIGGDPEGPLHERRALTPDKLELIRLSRAFRKRTGEFEPAATPFPPEPEPTGAPPSDEVLEITELELTNPPPEGESL